MDDGTIGINVLVSISHFVLFVIKSEVDWIHETLTIKKVILLKRLNLATSS